MYNIIHKTVSRRHNRRTETQPRVTSVELCVNFGHVVSEICVQRDRRTHKQTNMLITMPCSLTGGGGSKNSQQIESESVSI